jgi:hypothetical protein
MFPTRGEDELATNLLRVGYLTLSSSEGERPSPYLTLSEIGCGASVEGV